MEQFLVRFGWLAIVGALLALPVTALQQEDEIVAVGGEGAATDLRDEGWCSEDEPGLAIAKLMWRPAAEGTEQRVDFTMTRDGFEKAIYSSLEPVPAGESSTLWHGIEPGINYYWRVLTLTADGWVASETSRCKGPICPVDSRPGGDR